MGKKVIILVGPSGCGKSTWIANYEKCGEWDVCSADHFFVKDGIYQFDGAKLGSAHAASKEKFLRCLDDHLNIIFVDNTNTQAWERQSYIDPAKKAGYEVWLQVFDVDVETCVARNTHGVPYEAVKRMADRIDVPVGFYQV